MIKFTLKINPVHLVGISELRNFWVHNQRVFVPAVPKLPTDLKIFVGFFIPPFCFLMGNTVICRLVVINRGEHSSLPALK